MGKLSMKKRIEDEVTRRVTFAKRRSGLMKKARELSILCDADIGVVVISASGRKYEFCSSNDGLSSIVQRYENHSMGKGKNPKKHHSMEKGKNPLDNCETEDQVGSNHKTCFELLQILERQLEEPFVDQMTVPDLLHLEEQIRDTLEDVRSTKSKLITETVLDLHEKEIKLTLENKAMEDEVAASTSGGDKASNTAPEPPRFLQFL